MFDKAILVLRGVGQIAAFLSAMLSRSISFRLKLLRHSLTSSTAPPAGEPLNIVIIGASIAGYHAASTIAANLPPWLGYRVVVVEPRDHFHFTWVLPRFCVVEGHEHKAFIPYAGHLPAGSLDDGPGGAPSKVAWVRDRVASISPTAVRLAAGGADIPYAFLVVATGAGAGDALPNRVPADGKAEGLELLRRMQARIRDAADLVVVGGGAAGVELATDAKSKYPDKRVTLVHSRDAVMHRFGPRLQAAARDGIDALGVRLVTGDRVVSEDKDRRVAVLKSGREIPCDCLINCTGQRPDARLVAALSPASVSATTGHVLVRPTMQVRDPALPNVYACGDVCAPDPEEDSTAVVAQPNSRSAMRQAMVAAFNVLDAAEGRAPSNVYRPNWFDGVIKLTLGLDKSVSSVGDGKTELLFRAKDKDVALMVDGVWKRLGATPFEDDDTFLSKVKTKI
ncbi:FAD/NAD(P)-binding domain-containing protein [Durotheca rogersii]|uniref:FAD/NAD(P)-binding domain-containing protein n=1 Tax=Durotheca rogersii TaxID=419775 RepID=UPI00221F37F4|nr:FAD/NAD(P)-binding domain-containing protein [Durotheca rogersii]KAI5860064.1 FAD/NAD(P)-binding domain-containing protein [Durotheca rogersii]